jgi:signal transduction histidine kinase
MSVVFVGGLAAYLVVRRWGSADATIVTGQIWSLTIPGVAGAFLIGLARERMAVGDVLSRLSVALSHRLDVHETRATLASALGDARLELLLPCDEPGRWRREDGSVTSAADAADGTTRRLTVIEDDENVAVAALVHDPVLLAEDDLFVALRALIVATFRHRLAAARLETSLAELAQSRQRIAAAADIERTRIEQDLHDGAQQRLIGLRIKLSVAEEQTRSDPMRGLETMQRLGSEIELALEELRSLAHGVYPSLLTDRGLEDALRGVAFHAQVRMNLITHGLTRLPAEIETAVYFTCLEAIQNAVRHAGADPKVWVTIRQNGALEFDIQDDGVGFTPHAQGVGGLRNMRDRVEAIGGHLAIRSAPGRGTLVSGVVPLGGDRLALRR